MDDKIGSEGVNGGLEPLGVPNISHFMFKTPGQPKLIKKSGGCVGSQSIAVYNGSELKKPLGKP
jgi:hypothetical protein